MVVVEWAAGLERAARVPERAARLVQDSGGEGIVDVVEVVRPPRAVEAGRIACIGKPAVETTDQRSPEQLASLARNTE